MKMVHEIHIDDCWNRIGVWGKGDHICPRLKEVIHCRNCHKYSIIGKQLLKRPISEDYIESWTRTIATLDERQKDKGRSALVFRIGDEWFALELEVVKEVAEMSPIHSLPHRHHYFVLGVVSVRGKLETCVSLEEILGIPHSTTKSSKKGFVSPERLIVVEEEGVRFVFPCQEISGIVRYEEQQLREVPVTLAKSRESFTKKILYFDGMEMGLLDQARLFNFIKGSSS